MTGDKHADETTGASGGRQVTGYTSDSLRERLAQEVDPDAFRFNAPRAMADARAAADRLLPVVTAQTDAALTEQREQMVEALTNAAEIEMGKYTPGLYAAADIVREVGGSAGPDCAGCPDGPDCRAEAP